MTTSQAVDLADVQALVATGMAHLPAHRTRLLRITDPGAARRSMATWPIASARSPAPNPTVQVAFTAAGLTALGLSNAELGAFSRPFREGIGQPDRARRLGEDPTRWSWGADDRVHLWVGTYAQTPGDEPALALDGLEPAGGNLVGTGPLGREHFGFRDGISQPAFLPLHRVPHESVRLAPGEFLLGHRDESGGTPATPPAPLGPNGTYLVAMELVQDVQRFWDDARTGAQRLGLDPVALAEKMVGRSIDGKPLGDVGPTGDLQFRTDPGTGCPVGSHVRRSYPRDSGSNSASGSLAANRRHRIARRGRAFGPPAPAEWYPAGVGPLDAICSEHESRRRGLVFISLQADLERQFELIQGGWCRNPNFQGLEDAPDPLLGRPGGGGSFTIPRVGRAPLRAELAHRPPVALEGAAYGFLPSLTALRALLD